MACGTPVVASAVPALAELVGDAGFLCDPSDASCFARHVLALARDEGLRTALGAQGRSRSQKFGWAAAARKFITAITDLEGALLMEGRADSGPWHNSQAASGRQI